MITQNDFKVYRDLAGYFEYIIESMTNGNRSQAAALFKKLSKDQRKQFLLFLANEESQLTSTKGIDLNKETLKYCISLIY